MVFWIVCASSFLPSPQEEVADRELTDVEELRLRTAQIRQLFAQADSSLYATLTVGIAMTALLWDTVPRLPLVAWMTAVAVIVVPRLVLVKRFRRTPPDEAELDTSYQWYLVGTVVSGFTWGSLAILFLPTGSMSDDFFIVMCIAGIGSGAVATYSQTRATYLAYVLPAMLLVAGKFFSRGDQPGVVMGIIVLVFTVVLLQTGDRVFRSTTQSLTMRFENQRLIAELKESEELSRALSEASFEAVFLTQKGICIGLNQAAVEMFGYSREEAIGKNGLEVIVPEHHGLVRERMLTGNVEPYEARAMRKNGDTFLCEIRPKMISYRGRTVRVTALRDIDERKKSEELIETQRQRLSYILEGTNVGTWEWNVQSGETVFNERWAQIIGYCLEELSPVSIDTWMKFAHPDDLEQSNELLQKHFNRELDYYECEARMRHKSGDWVWVLDRGRVATWTEDGKPLLMSGTHTDITERKRSEQARQQAEHRYRALFDQTHDAVFILDLEGNHIDANRRAAQLLGYSEEELKHLSFRETSAQVAQSKQVITRLLKGEQLPMYERQFRAKDGQEIPVEITVELVRDTEGTPVHIQSVVRDITERKRMEEELKHMATHDSLTDLPNRTLLSDRLDQAMARSRRNRQPVALMLVDLDDFKGINDTYGHSAGDKLLQDVAERLRTQVRKSDTVARIGGDEFVIVLPDLQNPEDPCRFAQKILATFEQQFTFENHEFSVCASIGISVYPDDGEDAETLMKHSDSALYHAKEQGRNRCFCYRDVKGATPD